MNERIKVLWEQCKTVKWSVDHQTYDHEAFAELIVLECINTVSDCSVEYSTRPQIVNEIKEHFGVEE